MATINSSGGGTVTNLPTILYESVSNITSTSATFNAQVNPNGSATTVYFQYGVNSNALTPTSPITISNSADLNIVNSENFPVEGLPPNSVIYFQAVAYNFGGFVYETVVLFHTPPVGPIATTLAATNITATGASLNGTVNPNGVSTSYYFEYGPASNNYVNFTTTNVLTTGSNQPVAAAIIGLAAGSTNHFQLVAFNSVATNDGGDLFLRHARGAANH